MVQVAGITDIAGHAHQLLQRFGDGLRRLERNYDAQQDREHGPTMLKTIVAEVADSPFLRSDSSSVELAASALSRSPLEVFIHWVGLSWR